MSRPDRSRVFSVWTIRYGMRRRGCSKGDSRTSLHISSATGASLRGNSKLAFALYHISESWRIREERQADLEVIRRGYGRGLLALMLHAQARGYPPRREHGLLPAEVRSRLRAPGRD